MLKRLAKGSFWSLIHSIATRGITILQGIVLARLFGVSGFGEWGIILSTIALVSLFSNFGLSLTASKHVAQWHASQPDRLGKLLGLLTLIATIMGLVAAILLIVFSSQIAQKVLTAPQLSSALSLIGFIAFFSALTGLYGGILTGLERFYELTIIGIGTTILGVLSTVIPAIWFGVDGAVAGLLFTSTITVVIYANRALFWLRQSGVEVTYRGCWQERYEIWATAIPTTLASMMTTPVYWLMYAFLVHQPAGYEAMGGFQAGNQWRNAVLFLPMQMLAAFLPVMASLLATSPEKLKVVQMKSLMSVGAAAAISAFIVILLAPFISGLYGEEFKVFYLVFVLLALQGALEACNSVFRNTIIAVGRSWYLLISNGAFGFIALSCAILLIPKYAATGLAFSLVLAQAVHLLMQGAMSYRALDSISGSHYESSCVVKKT